MCEQPDVLDEILRTPPQPQPVTYKFKTNGENGKLIAKQKNRLENEIEEIKSRLSRPYERGWLKSADERRLELKDESLSVVLAAEKALKRADAAEFVTNPIENFYGIELLIRESETETYSVKTFIDAATIPNQNEALEVETVIRLIEEKHPDTTDLEWLAYAFAVLRDSRKARSFIQSNRAGTLKRFQELQVAKDFVFTQLRPSILQTLPKSEPLTKINAQSVNQYFDGEKFPRESEFLKKLDVKPLADGEIIEANFDFSSRFHPPCYQLGTYACVAFAATSDMETFPEVPPLSSRYLYALSAANYQFMKIIADRAGDKAELVEATKVIVEDEKNRNGHITNWAKHAIKLGEKTKKEFDELRPLIETPDGIGRIPIPNNFVDYLSKVFDVAQYETSPDYSYFRELGPRIFASKVLDDKILTTGTIPLAVMELTKNYPIPSNQNFPWESRLPSILNEVPGRIYSVEDYATTQASIFDWKLSPGLKDPNFYKLILSKGITPQFSIDTDARRYLEDWIYFEANTELAGPEADVAGHILNVVGVGRGTDPLYGIEVDYLIVRDSLDHRQSHNQPSNGLHYRVPIRLAAKHGAELYKITKVRTWDNPPTHKDQ